MRKGVFVETSNVRRFRSALDQVRDTAKGQPGLMVARGRAGRGKTVAALNAYATGGGVFLRVWEDMTQAAFLSRLCFEACELSPVQAARSKMEIIKSLEGNPRVVFVDEADRLATSRIEDLRDIHDETGCPVVLIGEEGLYAKLNALRRLWSRVTQHVEFGPTSEEDILLYAAEAAGLQLSPEACHEVARISEGDFRLVHTALLKIEQAAKAKAVTQVQADMVRTVCGKGRT